MGVAINIGTHLICDGYDGVVVAIVPPLYNPIRELRRRCGNVRHIQIRHRGGEVKLREHESYVVMQEWRGMKLYRWPLVSSVRVRDE